MRVVLGVVALPEDPEAVPTHGVGSVVVEFIKGNKLRTIVSRPGGTVRNVGGSKPETEMSPPSTGIVAELVVWVDDPEAGGVDVGVEKGVGHPGEDGQVVLESVECLHSVLQINYFVLERSVKS